MPNPLKLLNVGRVGQVIRLSVSRGCVYARKGFIRNTCPTCPNCPAVGCNRSSVSLHLGRVLPWGWGTAGGTDRESSRFTEFFRWEGHNGK